MSPSQALVTLVVPVKPGRIFDLLATPHRLPDIDPAGTVVSDDNTAPVTAAGQVFTMNMVALGGAEPLRYQAEHHVDVFEHNRTIGWQVVPVGGEPHGWSWRFDLARLDGKRTEVTLTYDWSRTSDENAARFGIPDHDSADLEACLMRLAIEVKK
jgi:hypothetical protein